MAIDTVSTLSTPILILYFSIRHCESLYKQWDPQTPQVTQSDVTEVASHFANWRLVESHIASSFV